MIVLRTYSPFPPGEFQYTQPLPQGGTKIFTGDGLSIEQQSRRVLAFRKDNQIPGASFQQVVVDISQFTCQRLGGNTQFCFDTDAPPVPAYVMNGRGCSTCGSK